jgi:hypothetical protein
MDRAWLDLGVTAALGFTIIRKGWELFTRQQSSETAMMELMFKTLMDERRQDREERKQLMTVLLNRDS